MSPNLQYDSDQFYILKATCNRSVIGYLDQLRELALTSDRQTLYNKPMPWIGMYISVASLFCTLAMMADLLHGMRNRKLWLPCKFFTLNAASLTVMAVAMKLPMDLNNLVPGDVDQGAKIAGVSFMCTMMANLLPSLATMDSKELVSNIIALAILVITLVVNVCIQIYTGIFINVVSDEIGFLERVIYATVYVVPILMMLIIYACSSLAILKSKQILELKYQAAHQTTLKDQELQVGRLLSVEMLKKHVSNYGIMAGTGSPQFMLASSATTSAAGVICAASTGVLILATIFDFKVLGHPMSDYKWSMSVIFIIQFIGTILGTIAPVARCFATLSFKFSVKWIWKHVKWLRAMFSPSSIVLGPNPAQPGNYEDLRRYVLLLQDDIEFADRTLKGISKSMNHLIRKAEKRQPQNLMKLLETSLGFEGVEKYDSRHVESVVSDEYLNCWSLPLVTLTSIAMSLPNNQKKTVDCLVSGVSEGLVYVKHVEKNLNAIDDHVIIQNAAKTLWVEVEIYHKWLGNNLPKPKVRVNTPAQILQWLRDTAKDIVDKVEEMDIKGRNGNSKYKSICANSMYRITETMLSNHENFDEFSQEELFGKLSSMIADILAACLTNLPQVIAMKCHTSSIEKREASVQAAAQLLGETTHIINSLQDRELPSLNPDELAFIDKWRACLENPFP
ncbi:hypothetical protein L2E82_34741 [Cichorium intybus]|uniref:Uncharacterized protein n=1 Tax=Cichorium intybus TaxID=13427 RepID=A0ACB9BML1_CICIN|nr:hypothetical protein L2E82_34741 [Cichorium intybus]